MYRDGDSFLGPGPGNGVDGSFFALPFFPSDDGTRRARQLHTSIDTDTTRPKAEELKYCGCGGNKTRKRKWLVQVTSRRF